MSISSFNLALLAPRAPYAAGWRQSRGRLVGEPQSPTRSEFQRDRDRVLHSTAFRRLAHKTQVFVPHEGDHFRTRLTHSLEVAQIARALARSLGLDDDLAETLALAHDLGHPPFGHTGEEVLDNCLREFGGFDHNAQALKILTDLERRYAEFDGLNLTFESLEGLVKHNGPLVDSLGDPLPHYRERGIPPVILNYCLRQDLQLHLFAGGEAQAAAIADDIAYNAHDIDDGLRAGMFDWEEMRKVEFLAVLMAEIEAAYPNITLSRAIHELGRRLITSFVEDVIFTSRQNLQNLMPEDFDAIRQSGSPVIVFSAAMRDNESQIKRFLFSHLYHHPEIMRIRGAAAAILQRLFEYFINHSEELPNWLHDKPANERRRYEMVGDYIAGMTDRYVQELYRRYFGKGPSLRMGHHSIRFSRKS